MIENEYEKQVAEIFEKACKVLRVTGFSFRAMRRKAPVNTLKSYTNGYINLKTKVVCLDILTPKKREPKSINSLLRVIAHELAHFQKPPYRQFYRFRWITRQHYPAFYKQVNKNIEKIKKDRELGGYFK